MTPLRIHGNISDDVQKELEGYSPLLQKLLYQRGIVTKKEADIFVAPNWERDTNDPFLILNMEKAVSRIFKAIDENEKIVIYGDYDADGIPGGVVLHDFFKKIGYVNFSNYIPHRHDEGYGMNTDAIKTFLDDGVKLIITVDLGITDIEHVAFAQKNTIDVIVTDHHMPKKEGDKEILPPTCTVINSKQKDDTYPDDMLCGAGVAFKLVQALLKKGKEEGRFADIPEGWEKWLLDMVGLSTLADMVPLKKENRTFARFGLMVLRKSKRVGVQTLLRKLQINQAHLTEDDIGFMIVPRINAASRMDHPLRAFELLSTSEQALAETLVDHLNTINDKRKGHVAVITKEAKKRLLKRELNGVIVLGDTEWSPAVLGLVANKLMEEHGRPAFVWGYDGNGVIKGSCRGTGSMSVVDLMRGAPEGTFIDIGGHHDAGGFSVSKDHIHTLEETLSKLYKELKADIPGRVISIAAELSLDDVNWKTFEDIDMLSPFGVENEKPIFLFKGVTISDVRLFGKEKNHLGVDFRNSTGKKVSTIGFFMTPDMFPLVNLGVGEKIDLVAVLEKSMFRNMLELRLRIETILPFASR